MANSEGANSKGGSENACPQNNPMEETSETLHSRQVRTVYLITYSQANLERVPKREDFASLVVGAFTSTCDIEGIISHWACKTEGLIITWQ